MLEVASGKFRSRCREGHLLSDTWVPCAVPELNVIPQLSKSCQRRLRSVFCLCHCTNTLSET